jgi:hypothetical protein
LNLMIDWRRSPDGDNPDNPSRQHGRFS